MHSKGAYFFLVTLFCRTKTFSVGGRHIPYYHLFSQFKKFREIKVPRKKGAAKIKDAKFSDLYKIFI